MSRFFVRLDFLNGVAEFLSDGGVAWLSMVVGLLLDVTVSVDSQQLVLANAVGKGHMVGRRLGGS